MKHITIASLTTALLVSQGAWSKDNTNTPGLLPEIKLQGDNPEADDKKSLETELMIRRSEQMAIKKLQVILKERQGQAEEPHLLYRLAELYMRRAKTGRFFDVNRNNKVLEMAPPEARQEDAKKSINAAIIVYNRIQDRFPKYDQMDEIYFQNAFAHQQLRRNNAAQVLYTELLRRYPNSPFSADGHIALGEMAYEAQNFASAWEHFSKVQSNPNGKLYSFALYKGAWTLYNLHKNEEAMASLEKLVKLSEEDQKKQLHNLRGEALRDLVVFYGDTRSPDVAYRYFASLSKPDEIGQIVGMLANLYQSHSREQDAIALLQEFEKKNPEHADRTKIGLHMIELSESLKNRPVVLAQIESLQKICQPQSEWFVAQPKGYQDEICAKQLGEETLRLASKWWEVWKKNDHATQFADWSEKAFGLYLSSGSSEKESKVRFAYADLLFQRLKFAEASFQYEKTSRLEKTGELAEKAGYASLVSLEKSISDKWDEKSEKRLYSLSQFYLQSFPQSKEQDQVRFKLAYVSYERGRLDEAKKHLQPLAEKAKDETLRVKAEDLYLDVLNVEKDFSGLRSWAASAAARSGDGTRKSRLEELSREARMAEIEIYAQEQPLKAAQAYEDFYRNNKDHKLALPAFLNAIRLNNQGSDPLRAALLAIEFARAYPKHEKRDTLLQEAARIFEQTARPLEAAKTLEMLAETSAPSDQVKWQEIAADYYTIEGYKEKATALYFKLADTAKGANKAALYSKIYNLSDRGSASHQKAEAQLVSLRVEPYWSELMIADAKRLYEQNKKTEAFSLAMKIMGQSSDAQAKSQARLIQADILRDEFKSQSLRSNLDRLTLVLSLKTEKLEKAQKAYLSAQSMAIEPTVQKRALEGLREIYATFVTDIKEMPAPRGLASAGDEKTLRSELTALTDPIEMKQKETEEAIKALQARSFASAGEESRLKGLSASQSLSPLTYQETYQLGAYVPFIGGAK